MIPRLLTIAAVYAACVLGIALTARLVAALLADALDDWRAFTRLRRMRDARMRKAKR